MKLGKCECGCGGEVRKKGNRFINGHNSIGKNNPNWHGGNIKKNCEYCHKEYYINLARINTSKYCSTECKYVSDCIKYKGKDNPNYGKHHSQRTKDKISKARRGKYTGNKSVRWKNRIKKNCKCCGKEFEILPRKADISKYCSRDCMWKYIIENNIRAKENNANWHNGSSFEPYCPKFNNKLREHIRDKYDRKCVICGRTETENGKKLCVHHITYDKMEGCNDKEFTLVPLCMKCHAKTNSNRKFWKQYFIDKLNTLVDKPTLYVKHT